MSKTKFSLLSILDAIRKIENFSNEFSDAETFYHDEKSYNQSGAVLDPRTGRAVPFGVSASVMAPTCVMADALTKCILMLKSEGDTLLHQFDARGFLVDGEHVTSYPRTEKTITSYAN